MASPRLTPCCSSAPRLPDDTTTTTPANDSTAPVSAPKVRRWPRLMIAAVSAINGISDRMMPMLVARGQGRGVIRQALVHRHAQHAEDEDLAQVRADLRPVGDHWLEHERREQQRRQQPAVKADLRGKDRTHGQFVDHGVAGPDKNGQQGIRVLHRKKPSVLMKRDYPLSGSKPILRSRQSPLHPDNMARHTVRLADFRSLPSPVYFRYSDFAPDTECTPHQHFWGSLDYSASGVMRMEVAGNRFMSPPQYAVWIPPNTEHSSYNAQAIVYHSWAWPRALRATAAQPCTLAISDILKAILATLPGVT